MRAQKKDRNGNIISGIDQAWCQTKIENHSDLGTLIMSDVPGGMAQIYSGSTIHDASEDPTRP